MVSSVYPTLLGHVASRYDNRGVVVFSGSRRGGQLGDTLQSIERYKSYESNRYGCSGPCIAFIAWQRHSLTGPFHGDTAERRSDIRQQ
jgi:hypothetical protein